MRIRTYAKATAMAYLTMSDGLHLFYRDWGRGPPLVLSHGWPLDAGIWHPLMIRLRRSGYRVIAHDRRGYGRSDRHPLGEDIDTYADDLACLLQRLDLTDVTLIGHGAGGGEIARLVGRYGTQRVSRVILISTLLPGMLETDSNPYGLPKSHFDAMRDEVAMRRSDFTKRLATAWFNLGPEVPASLADIVQRFCSVAMSASADAACTDISAFLERDFTADLAAFDVPTFFIHGTGDQMIPFQCSTQVAAALVRNSTVKVYPGAPHGLCLLFPEQIAADIHAFLAD